MKTEPDSIQISVLLSLLQTLVFVCQGRFIISR